MGIEAGQRIGNYQVIRPIGAGGLGAVYEVKHAISGRSEALKVMLPGLLETPELAERFHREIRLLASLNHFNIATLHTAFYHENQLVMVMEFVEGQTFASLTRGAPVSVASAIHWISQVLSALGAAHAAGIIHRDIKPGNIMLTKDGVVKLLDFGIAFREASPHLTQAGHIFGSLNYMSPEQFTGGPVTPLSDIYSAGITLYELVTRQLPFTGSTTYEIMTAHLEKTPVPPNQLNPSLPPFLCQAIERSLAKNPGQRFQSADEFRLALSSGTEALNGLPVASAALAETLMMPPQGSATPAYGHLAGSTSKPSTQRPAPATSTAESALPVEEVTKLLAIHIGPVAKFVVKKLSAQCTSADQLYAAAAKEIPSSEARNQFLRSRRR
jgi:serine/threonine-protein kinase